MAQFVQTHSEGKTLLYKGYKYLKIHDGKECTVWRCKRHKSQSPASDHLLTFIEKKAPSMYAIITSGGVPAHLYNHVFMQRLTVDFVGS